MVAEVGMLTNPSGQQVAFSPTYCSMVQLGDNGKLKWSKLHHPDTDIGDSMKDGTLMDASGSVSTADSR